MAADSFPKVTPDPDQVQRHVAAAKKIDGHVARRGEKECARLPHLTGLRRPHEAHVSILDQIIDVG